MMLWVGASAQADAPDTIGWRVGDRFVESSHYRETRRRMVDQRVVEDASCQDDLTLRAEVQEASEGVSLLRRLQKVEVRCSGVDDEVVALRQAVMEATRRMDLAVLVDDQGSYVAWGQPYPLADVGLRWLKLLPRDAVYQLLAENPEADHLERLVDMYRFEGTDLLDHPWFQRGTPIDIWREGAVQHVAERGETLPCQGGAGSPLCTHLTWEAWEDEEALRWQAIEAVVGVDRLALMSEAERGSVERVMADLVYQRGFELDVWVELDTLRVWRKRFRVVEQRGQPSSAGRVQELHEQQWEVLRRWAPSR